ncbi:MAG TPA: hypothetical protein VLT82_22980 [Myxococcaceae bacterium]|nr:hypothetical protein [Myxococcaceae bacterium]
MAAPQAAPAAPAPAPSVAPAPATQGAPAKPLLPPGAVPVQQAPSAAPAATPGTQSVDAQPGKAAQEDLPPPGLAREVYYRDMLRVRPHQTDVFTQHGARKLSATEFYRLVGRGDLASASDVRKSERGILYGASFLTFAAGIASGIIVSGNAQSLNDPACFTNGTKSYNQCVDSAQKTSLYGALLIGGGVVVGGLLLTIAALTPDMVTTPEETARLAEQYNRGLSKRLAAASEPRVQVTPVFGKDGGGLAARFTF